MEVEESHSPTLEANTSLLVEELTVVAIDGQHVHMPVRALLHLAPTPRFVLNYEAFPPDQLNNKAGSQTLCLDNGGKVQVLRPRPLPGPAGLRGVLHPTKQPFTVFDRGDSLQAVSFSVINFPDLHGSRDKVVENGGRAILCGRAELETPCFRVTLIASRDLRRNKELLAANGGYAITHNGHLSRRDRDVFPRKEADRVLRALRRFLSFARGTSCAIVQVHGETPDSERSWARWGSHGVAEWNQTPSWVHSVPNGMDALGDAFSGFWAHFENDSKSSDRSVELAIDWYTSANETNAVVPGLVLSQAALERLTHKDIGPKSQKGKNQEKTGVWIGRALINAGINDTIPAELRHLVAASQQHGWASGPHAIVATRNDLVHPLMTKPVPTEVLIEAQRLSQWYVELLLLKRFGYAGSYRNRVKQAWESVPWAVAL